MHAEKRGQNERSSRYWLTGMKFIEMEDTSPPMTNREVRKINMNGLHEETGDMLRPLTPVAEACFQIRTKLREEPPWNCFPLNVSYCGRIQESRDISAVKPIVTVRLPCVRGLTTISDVHKPCQP